MTSQTGTFRGTQPSWKSLSLSRSLCLLPLQISASPSCSPGGSLLLPNLGEMPLLRASQVLHLRVALACLLDRLNEMRAVSTFSTHICPQQRLPYVNTQSWLTGRAGPAEEACVGVLNGIVVLE